MTAPLRVAVVGAGVHGARYAEHILRGDVPGAALAGVCRRSPEAGDAWRDRRVRFETEWQALVEDPAVDAVVVATPPSVHRAPTLAALARGKPVILEKPVAHTPEDLAALRDAAAGSGVPVLVGHALRFNPVCRAWRDAIGSMSRVVHLGLSQRHERQPYEWLLDAAEGGALLTCAVHLVDLVRWATGSEFETILAATADRAAGDPEGSATVLARLASGTVVSLDASIAAPGRRGGLEAHGPDEQVDGDYLDHVLWRRRGRERIAVPLPDRVHGLVPLLRSFVAAAGGGDAGGAALLEDGIRAVEVVLDARART